MKPRQGHVPLLTKLRRDGLALDVITANIEARRWLREVANARVHGTTGQVPALALDVEQAALLPVPLPWRGEITAAKPRASTPVKSDPGRPLPAFPAPWRPTQHPLSVYAELAEAR